MWLFDLVCYSNHNTFVAISNMTEQIYTALKIIIVLAVHVLYIAIIISFLFIAGLGRYMRQLTHSVSNGTSRN